MRKCKFESLIDNYLLNRLSSVQKKNFEEHYFNCSHCFEKIVDRDELISVVKNKGSKIFRDLKSSEVTKKEPVFQRIFSFLTPKQWAVAAASAVFLLVIIIGVVPSLRNKPPQFFINENLVRGKSITLISPVIDIKSIPSQFKWEELGKDVEYKISIYNQDLLWSETTKNNYIQLPEAIKKRMSDSEKYFWEVKAFSPEGILVAVSSRVQFKITKEE